MKLSFNLHFVSLVSATALIGPAEGNKHFLEEIGLRGIGVRKDLTSADKHARGLVVQVSSCGTKENNDYPILSPNRGSTSAIDATDGSIADWGADLPSDFFRTLYNTGEPDSSNNNYEEVGNVYVRYDCITGRICVLIEATTSSENGDETCLEKGPTDSLWFKIYDGTTGGSNKVVPDEGWTTFDEDGDKDSVNPKYAEACFDRRTFPNCHARVEIHSNWGYCDNSNNGKTGSTGKYATNNDVGLDLTCPCDADGECYDTPCHTDICTEGLCAYEEIQNCCTSSDDCSDLNDEATCKVGHCNDAGECTQVDDGTGECEEEPPCNVDNDCARTCYTGVCVSDECIRTPIAAIPATRCGEENYQLVSSCDLGFSCDGLGNCVRGIKEGSCNDFPPPDSAEECYEGRCNQTNGRCERVPTEGNLCTLDGKSGQFAHGPCDAGSNCVISDTDDSVSECTPQYYPDTKTCASSDPTKCCDADDKCEGDSYDCPDLVATEGTVCREICPGCIFDPVEECDGSSKDCPPNVLLDTEFCIKAGQNYDAGSLAVRATEDEICLTIALKNGWELNAGTETIKAEIIVVATQDDAVLDSAPGGYSLKFPDQIHLQDDGTYKICKPFTLEDQCDNDLLSKSILFAVHLDVKHSVYGGQTAWALNCGNDGFVSSCFLNSKNKCKGWGQFHIWTPCCFEDCGCHGGSTCQYTVKADICCDERIPVECEQLCEGYNDCDTDPTCLCTDTDGNSCTPPQARRGLTGFLW